MRCQQSMRVPMSTFAFVKPLLSSVSSSSLNVGFFPNNQHRQIPFPPTWLLFFNGFSTFGSFWWTEYKLVVLDTVLFFRVWTSAKHLGRRRMCPHRDWEMLLQMLEMSWRCCFFRFAHFLTEIFLLVLKKEAWMGEPWNQRKEAHRGIQWI